MPQPARTPSSELDALDLALERAARRLAALQREDGSWAGDYGGPMFLLPGYVAVHYAARRPIPAEQRRDMARYLFNVQHDDGSVGLHAEAEAGCMFTTVLSYVALRLLGHAANEPELARMGRWIRAEGGAVRSASWGKLTLALLNLYPYEGMHPLTPELWILPRQLPIHPSRMWCHCRQVYLPMAYLYGARAQIPLDPLLSSLRGEIYSEPYDAIDFARQRDALHPGDKLVSPSPVMRLVNGVTGLYERLRPRPLRRLAQARLLEHIRYEDRATSTIRIGPVNAVLNTFVHLFASPGSEAVQRGFVTLEGYLWPGHDGTKMNGYNSCALWDTAFAVQALLGSGQDARQPEALLQGHRFIRDNQVLEDLPQGDRYYRHRCRGGWPFSDRPHGWPITDCTAEGLKCALALEARVEQPVPEPLLAAAVELILSFQNPDGSWSTYERKRGSSLLELLNPSGVFADIMVDYGYVECTSACIQALTRASARFPERFQPALSRAVRKGERFLRRRQRADGSFEGSWAVCFTYGTWFGVWGLRAAGVRQQDPAVQRACDFLERHQRDDGGWGEHYTSCLERRYVPHPEGQVVQTAWALLALARGGRGDGAAARRAAQFLLLRQQPDGDWPREAMVGVFNKTTLINYDNYRRYFPLWALGLYRRARA